MSDVCRPILPCFKCDNNHHAPLQRVVSVSKGSRAAKLTLSCGHVLYCSLEALSGILSPKAQFMRCVTEKKEEP